MHSPNRVAKNTAFLYVKMVITVFISLYTTRLILNSLGASDFGIFNIVGGAIAMLGFLNVAMAGATQRFMSYSAGEGDEEKLTKIFNISIVLHFGIAVVMSILLLIVGWFFFHGVLNIAPDRIYAAKIVYTCLIISTLFTVITVPYDAVLNSHENMLYYSIVGIIESLLKLVVAIIVMLSQTDKLVLYGFLMAFIPLIILIIMRIYCHKTYKECIIAPKRYWDKNIMKEMSGFAGWNFASTASSITGNYGVGLVLNHFFGTVLNASFGIAGQLNGQLVSFSNNMMKALNPAIVKAEGGGERQNMIRLSLLGCKYSFFLFSFFSIPFLIETPLILKLWLKNVPDWAVIFCRLAILRTLLEQLTLALNTSIGAQGDIKKVSLVRSVFWLIPIPIIIVLFQLGFPAYSMLIVTLVFGGLIEGGVTIFFAINKCGLSLIDFFGVVVKRVMVVFIVTLFIGLFTVNLFNESIYRLILTLLVCMSSFVVMFFQYGLTKEEKNQVGVLIKNLWIKVKR